MYCGSSASSLSRKSGTPLRSMREWNGTSMPGSTMNGLRPPYSAARRAASAPRAFRPATVPATTYCEPERL